VCQRADVTAAGQFQIASRMQPWPNYGCAEPEEPIEACGRTWCDGAWSTVGAVDRRVVGGDWRTLRENAGGWVCPGGGSSGGMARVDWVGFSVDVVSKACDPGAGCPSSLAFPLHGSACACQACGAPSWADSTMAAPFRAVRLALFPRACPILAFGAVPTRWEDLMQRGAKGSPRTMSIAFFGSCAVWGSTG